MVNRIAIIASIVVALIVIAILIWLFWPKPMTTLLAINSCDSTDLEMVADENGNYYSVYDCPVENRIELVKVMNDASNANDYEEPQAIFEGVGQSHVSISVAPDGTVYAFAVVGGELRSVTCEGGNITGCTENPASINDPSSEGQGEEASSIMPNDLFQNVAYYHGLHPAQIVPVHEITECLGHHDSDVGPDDTVYEVWENNCTQEIWFSASYDKGATWDQPINLSHNSGDSSDPRIAVLGDVVYVTWVDNNAGNAEILSSRSLDRGKTFNGATGNNVAGDATNLSNTPQASADHEICASGNNLYIAWSDSSTGNGDIYFARNNAAQDSDQDSYIRGFAVQRLDSDAQAAYEPDIDCQDGGVIAGFTRETQSSAGHGDAFFTQSTDSGQTFSEPINVSKNANGDSKTALVSITRDNEIYEAWLDTDGDRQHIADGTYAVFASKSMDGGRSFSNPTNYSDNPANLKGEDSVMSDVFELEDKVCAWDLHCSRCQSTSAGNYY